MVSKRKFVGCFLKIPMPNHLNHQNEVCFRLVVVGLLQYVAYGLTYIYVSWN